MTKALPLEGREDVPNKAAPGITYFTPAQLPPSGTASDPQPDGSRPPKLFQPLKLRGVTFQNRIMYSAEDGHHTAWHFAHLGGIISRGPGLSMIEATAVTPEGRITPEDSGLWKDSQMEPLRRIVEFAHSQGQKIGIQLGHAGRKASTVAPWLKMAIATEAVHGWPTNVYGPSAISWDETHAPVKAMTLDDIEALKTAFIAAVHRAVKIGIDVIEVHSAHGYNFHEFLSPVSNTRTDKYGGSFENRTRLLLEVVDATRAAIPDDMPLFVRVSATDWLEEQSDIPESWTVQDTIRLAEILATKGVDLLDVSSGGNHPKQHPHTGPAYQAPFAKAIKEKVGNKMAVGVVGSITSGKQANQLIEEGLDMAIVGRMFQKNPGLVWAWAEEMGVDINVANQIRWGFVGRAKK